MIRSVGIREKRYADDGVCASDLCFQAARQLMADNDIAPDSIDVLLFMSQTADYRLPATAPLLQHRLGLAQTTAAMDLSLGCSGYVYALSAAYAYASLPGVKRVLLLDAWLSEKSYVQTSSLVTLRNGNELRLDFGIVEAQGAEVVAVASLIGGVDMVDPVIRVVNPADDSTAELPFIEVFRESELH